MTVEQLIVALNKVQDKSKSVRLVINFDADGTEIIYDSEEYPESIEPVEGYIYLNIVNKNPVPISELY
jgi:hypothetical protein